MIHSGEKPNQFTFSVVIRACTALTYIELGLQIHGLIIHHGLEKDEFAGSSLVDMYFKFGGFLDDACHIFNGLFGRDAVTWNVMISGFAQVGDSIEVCRLFSKMQVIDGLKPNDFTFTSLLKCCCCLREVEQIHGLVLKFGTESDVVVGSALVDRYGKCGNMGSVRKVLDAMAGKDGFVWSSVISGYARNDCGEEAVVLFRDMCRQGLKPDQHALSSALKACLEIREIGTGMQIHTQMIKNGYEGSTACIKLYRELRQTAKPDEATVIAVLKSCRSQTDLTLGLQIHADIVKFNLSCETLVGNGVINMYSKCKVVDDARKAFDTMVYKDEGTWNSIIGSYVQNGVALEALKLCKEMLTVGIFLSRFSLPLCITASSALAVLDLGKQFHSSVIKFGFDRDFYVGSSVIDMYAKCGNIEDSIKVFHELRHLNVVIFNALISGFAQHGRALEAMEAFKDMEKMNIIPNKITFLAVLSACSHVGFVEESMLIFNLMCQSYGIEPEQEHYSCLIDTFGRAGRLEEASQLLQNSIGVSAWRTLLSRKMGRSYGYEAENGKYWSPKGSRKQLVDNQRSCSLSSSPGRKQCKEVMSKESLSYLEIWTHVILQQKWRSTSYCCKE
ncbi:hypothetical protein NE237_025308 [Protea cynaroides]|uniref:Pentatricopeptide repeat-containing protein n=1 Tax=Protea cynaroides TaxID=273540 RepID=A0A9Q0H601_9MAGN|nr:hypothetical protein NE237_025308 [Protea cynaroides]